MVRCLACLPLMPYAPSATILLPAPLHTDRAQKSALCSLLPIPLPSILSLTLSDWAFTLNAPGDLVSRPAPLVSNPAVSSTSSSYLSRLQHLSELTFPFSLEYYFTPTFQVAQYPGSLLHHGLLVLVSLTESSSPQ